MNLLKIPTLFRGKYHEEHSWVYGHYYNNCEVGVNQDIIISYNEEKMQPEEHVIKTKFLGLYSGLDLGSTKLFTGDVIGYKAFGGIVRAIVTFRAGCFVCMEPCFKYENDMPDTLAQWLEDSNCFYLGNIYDNPELL